MTAAVKGGGSQPPSERLLSAKEAADYIGISHKRLYEFCRDRSLRHLRLADTKAGVLRFRRTWLDAWAEAKATGGIGRRPVATRPTRPRRRQRFWLVGAHGEVLRLITTASGIELLLEAAKTRSEERVMIYDCARGNFLIVWSGTPKGAGDPMLMTPCATCGHPNIEHLSPFMDGRCRLDGCTCQEFRS